ncbi:hypothetical protein pdam_00006032 [Pocillopora damicornis]|uniref:Uncharacterized protein n=1 Tax=Pocillopora damicornis TaxID=46731 RepID=A0A3M6TT05_POCDA|nr:hypothetical protein pdam_00006032 [Pocillopora damicornis]
MTYKAASSVAMPSLFQQLSLRRKLASTSCSQQEFEPSLMTKRATVMTYKCMNHLAPSYLSKEEAVVFAPKLNTEPVVVVAAPKLAAVLVPKLVVPNNGLLAVFPCWLTPKALKPVVVLEGVPKENPTPVEG